MDYSNYVKPEIAIIIPVLYALGAFVKNTKTPDWLIPFILGGAGIVLATIWTFSISAATGWRNVLAAIFTGITQGILAAAAAVYVNQLIKQGVKKN